VDDDVELELKLESAIEQPPVFLNSNTLKKLNNRNYVITLLFLNSSFAYLLY
jgi:hypothetical protein